MAKKTFHDSKRRINSLHNYVQNVVKCPGSSVEVSDVKSDGTVFIRFKSSERESAMFYAGDFLQLLEDLKIEFEQPDDTKFRIALDKFDGVSYFAGENV